jgi:hypothetical protein
MDITTGITVTDQIITIIIILQPGTPQEKITATADLLVIIELLQAIPKDVKVPVQIREELK